MSGLAQISATERPSAMRSQNLSAHSMLYLVGRPILAGSVDRSLVRGGIFITSSWRRDFGNAAAYAQAMTEAALSLFSVSESMRACESMLLFWAAKIVLQHSTAQRHGRASRPAQARPIRPWLVTRHTN